ncbi:hypothetical protein CISIN_1g030016mg [Citrus sinensis]|uniref:Uncharacterized protein n=1 Tax=Citrus sinensis TaxID=2711 RepID=A0A067GUP7_CITSI|nr:hypothetical protein CISIN_1g030016mg [Citrus sinensis]
MMSLLMNTANPWKRMEHGPDIWNCKQLLLLHIVIYAFIGSYHDGEHYNGVRLKEDSCIGSARPIIIKADADISAASIQSKTVTSKLKGAAGIINAGSIKLVMAGSGCENSEKVEEVLLQVGGDVDAAIEFLIAEQGTEEYSVKKQ